MTFNLTSQYIRHSLRDDIDHILVSEDELQISIGEFASSWRRTTPGRSLCSLAC